MSAHVPVQWHVQSGGDIPHAIIIIDDAMVKLLSGSGLHYCAKRHWRRVKLSVVVEKNKNKMKIKLFKELHRQTKAQKVQNNKGCS